MADAGDGTDADRSAAVAADAVDRPVPLLYPLVYLPERLRDWAYDLVAEHRYSLFGRRGECSVPAERVRERFRERMLA